MNRFRAQPVVDSCHHAVVRHASMVGVDSTENAPNPVEIKIVGKSGQISLGKSYAGKTLRLERRRDGTMILTAVAIVPESQVWTLEEPHRSQIARGLAWAAETPARETNLKTLTKRPGRPRGRK
jgi:hypothetical protein